MHIFFYLAWNLRCELGLSGVELASERSALWRQWPGSALKMFLIHGHGGERNYLVSVLLSVPDNVLIYPFSMLSGLSSFYF
jgi:hypothetical protein